MKELSIEQKARAYDEALSVARKTHQTQPMYKDWLEKMFPILAESENERIRKALKQYFINSFQNNGVAAICGVHIKDVLAWLEKQGKNNMGISEATKKKLEDNLNKALEKETPESWNKFLDEQGEQKPADKVEPDILIEESYQQQADDLIDMVTEKPAWSEEDEYCINQLIVFCENCMIPDSGAKRCADWLKSLKYRVLSQPKQEWSEQDERMKNQLVDFMLSGIDISKAPYGCVAWLKSLKNKVLPQPKTEWSEEDRLHYANVLEALEYVKGCKYDYDKIESVKSDIVWFKSLRPHNHWKPSGEQMKFLWKYAEQNNYDGRILGTLYNDLKKLRGE